MLSIIDVVLKLPQLLFASVCCVVSAVNTALHCGIFMLV